MSSSKPKETMQERKSFNFPPKFLYENRCCNQDDFSVLVCGGRSRLYRNWKSLFKLNGSNLEYKHYTLMPHERNKCKTAVINSELFVLCGFSKDTRVINLL